MRYLFRLIVWAIVDLFRSPAALEAEILTLRQQIIVLRRTAPKKQTFGAIDALAIVWPGTGFSVHTGVENGPHPSCFGLLSLVSGASVFTAIVGASHWQ